MAVIPIFGIGITFGLAMGYEVFSSDCCQRGWRLA